MFNTFKKIAKIIIFSLIVVIIHFTTASLLPYPLNQTNITLGFLILTLIIWNKEDVLWLALITGFITENFVTINFGINTLSITLGILATFWLYNNIFIHHSVFLVIILSLLSIIIYRMIFFILILGIGVLTNRSTLAIFSGPLLINVLWEILFTTVFIFITYLLFNYLIKRLKPTRTLGKIFYEKPF